MQFFLCITQRDFYDLLLSQGHHQKVQKRARQTLEISKRNRWLLTIALDNLSLDRAFWLLALSEAEGYLQQAVAGLREAGAQEFITRGLFARAACDRAQNEFALAWADLEEAREIAERGEMKLLLADYHLEACRLQGANGRGKRASGHCGEDDRGNGLRPAPTGGGGVAEAVAISQSVAQDSALQIKNPEGMPCL
ncbi:hypothetical protein EDS67_06010 [candidate division KSB1 bacterium]|nr:MAG: hypothetical protein EDS67_06010 [candidate division KSB1 bacterium]MBC6947226.1 hypothetical protein [candidate division KSB1 bacterium]MCE7940304.1 hypothetical protein [Chlorobi bacterium CHB1]